MQTGSKEATLFSTSMVWGSHRLWIDVLFSLRMLTHQAHSTSSTMDVERERTVGIIEKVM